MADLTTKILQTEKELEIKEERRKFSAKYLTITGQINVKLPGRAHYNNVNTLSVCYEHPMEVELDGRLLETKDGLEIKEGRMQIISYRENPAETALDKREEDMTIRRRIPDPEITLHQEGKTIVLNQVLGIPIIKINSGLLTYK